MSSTTSILALVVSGFSLVVSLLTLYFTFFYKRTALIGQMVAISTQSRMTPTEMEFECSFSNTGTREVLIREININLTPWPANELVPAIETVNLPLIIRSGEIKLVKFQISSGWIFAQGGNQIVIELKFELVSSDGSVYLMSKKLEPCVNEETLPESWMTPFKLNSREALPPFFEREN